MFPSLRVLDGTVTTELLTQKRALEVYRHNPEEWDCNVQPCSGSPANSDVYTGLFESTIFFESMSYKVDPVTELINYE